MALEAPLRSSMEGILSPYSSITPITDMSVSSPESASLPSQYMARSSGGSDTQSLRPNSMIRSHSSHLMSPSSDIVGPSPVTSTTSAGTEIEDEATEETARQANVDQAAPSQLMMIKTNIPDYIRKSLLSEEVVSVIHAPQSFHDWTSGATVPRIDGNISPPQSEHSSRTKSPTREPPPISTNVRPSRYSMEAPTPQAQNLPDVMADNARLRASTSSSLGLIPETLEPETDQEADGEDDRDDDGEEYRTPGGLEDDEIGALKMALEECWTLCNTLANLSSIHRERVFHNSGTPDAHEKAWKSCWKLCKRLYNSRDDTSDSFNVRTNLDLCRDFCQALFDIRQRKGDIADSVLRVSFELNNHLYSAQDGRSLPEAFRERTLDFYITLCHRLMKQRSESAEETDSLLRACWALAEMLFSLRQSRRDGKPADEELLGSAVQACWDLCDIFREGWTQVRPDRGTPRPSQVSFFSGGSGGIPTEAARSSAGSRLSQHSKRDSHRGHSEDRPQRKQNPIVPETPVTEFEDTPISPESASPVLPNIMVLGTKPENRGTNGGGHWSSSASTISGYSQRSAKTSSTATTANSLEDINITRIKTLVIKAAMNIGFNREAAASDGTGGTSSLQAFVKSLPAGSFGPLPNQATLLQNYKNLVLADSAFRTSGSLPARGKRTTSADVAKSVLWMTSHSGQYGFLRELYKLVFGFQLEDGESRKNVSIAI